MEMSAAAIWLNTVFASFDWSITSAIHKLYEVAGWFFTPFFDFVSFLGKDGIILIIASLALMFFKKTRRYGTAMFIAIALGAIVVNLTLKPLVARIRPYTFEPYKDLWQLVNMRTESDKCFPSGHTNATFACMLPLFMMCNKKYSWTALLFAVLMGISRIYLVVHYPTDVIAGAVTGILAGLAGYFLTVKVVPERFFEADIKLPVYQGKH